MQESPTSKPNASHCDCRCLGSTVARPSSDTRMAPPRKTLIKMGIEISQRFATLVAHIKSIDLFKSSSRRTRVIWPRILIVSTYCAHAMSNFIFQISLYLKQITFWAECYFVKHCVSEKWSLFSIHHSCKGELEPVNGVTFQDRIICKGVSGLWVAVLWCLVPWVYHLLPAYWFTLSQILSERVGL